MTNYVLANYYFSNTSSVVQKCRLRRLVSENTSKGYIRYGFTCLQKDGEYIPQGYAVHENAG